MWATSRGRLRQRREAAFHIEIINNDSAEQKAALPNGSSSTTPNSTQPTTETSILQILDNLPPITSKLDNLKFVPNVKPQKQ